jgi:hypothetical protein
MSSNWGTETLHAVLSKQVKIFNVSAFSRYAIGVSLFEAEVFHKDRHKVVPGIDDLMADSI